MPLARTLALSLTSALAAINLLLAPSAKAEAECPQESAVMQPSNAETEAPGRLDHAPISAPICRKRKSASVEDSGAAKAPLGSPVTRKQPGERRVKFYRNPMGLADVSPEPKKDQMGMDYIPVYEDEPTAGGQQAITISPEKIQRTGVETVVAGRKALTESVHAPGTVQLDETRISVIAPRFDGFVEKVEASTTGARVTKGDALFTLYGQELINQGTWLLVDVNAGTETSGRSVRKDTLITASRRLQELGAPEEFIDEIKRERRVPRSITVRAPRDGVVLERNAVEGQALKSGEAAFRIADISVVWVIADIPEGDVEKLSAGQTVAITARAHPGHEFHGKVALILPELKQETRTARVRIEIANDGLLLLPGMYADVDLLVGSTQEVVALPPEAIMDTGSRQVVFLERSDGRYEVRDVRLGRKGDDFVEILQGVAEGDKVVSNGNFVIDAESNLQSAIKSLSPPSNAEARR